MLIAAKILIGFMVGTLIGMTGIGGGVLLLPLLIFGLQVPPIIAVGSDALFNFFTKIGSGLVHVSRGTVRRRIIFCLALGSVPGSMLGVSFLGYLRSTYGTGVNTFITTAVGILLICIPTFLLLQNRIEEHIANRPPTMKSFAGVSAIGLLAGLLVGMTSVGSGSLMIVALMLLYPTLSSKELVGTDLVQAVPLVLAAAVGHLLWGEFELGLTGSLLLGSVPGVIIGAHVSSRAPDAIIRPILVLVLALSALKLLDVSNEVLAAVLIGAIVAGTATWFVTRRRARALGCERPAVPVASGSPGSAPD